jgi:hypothetical protein
MQATTIQDSMSLSIIIRLDLSVGIWLCLAISICVGLHYDCYHLPLYQSVSFFKLSRYDSVGQSTYVHVWALQSTILFSLLIRCPANLILRTSFWFYDTMHSFPKSLFDTLGFQEMLSVIFSVPVSRDSVLI